MLLLTDSYTRIQDILVLIINAKGREALDIVEFLEK